MKPLRYLRKEPCAHCHSNRVAELVRDIAANGVSGVYWLCRTCNKPFYKPERYIKHELLKDFGVIIENLPVIYDYSATGTPCAVCGARETEYHHWAPRHKFGDEAEIYPGAYLCKRHHKHWHDVLTPDMCERVK